MGDFLKEFTVIDILGMLVPGAFFLLFVSAASGEINFWQTYFGEYDSGAVRSTILIVAGYVVGSLIHEAADWAERFLWRATNSLIQRPSFYAMQKVGVKKIAERCKEAAIPMDETKFEGKSLDPDAYSEFQTVLSAIQAYMAGHSGEAKIRLFRGFHILMRNLLVSILIAFVLFGSKVNESIGSWIDQIGYAPGVAAVGLIFVLLSVRVYRYEYLSYKYLFENFCFRKSEAVNAPKGQTDGSENTSSHCA